MSRVNMSDYSADELVDLIHRAACELDLLLGDEASLIKRDFERNPMSGDVASRNAKVAQCRAGLEAVFEALEMFPTVIGIGEHE